MPRFRFTYLFSNRLLLVLLSAAWWPSTLTAQTGGEPANADSVQSAPNGSDSTKLFAEQPTVRGNLYRRAPLVAIIDFQTSAPTTVSVSVSDDDRTWQLPLHSKPTRFHSIPVLGMRPDRTHRFRVTATNADGGSQTSEELTFKTPALPASFPPLETLVSKPDKMEPGVTFFAVNLWRDSTSLLDYGFIIALDEMGEVVWYCNTTDRIADMRVMKNGHLLYQQGSYRYAYEIDLLGRDYRRWVATNLTELPDEMSIGVEVDTIHHDLLELPNGNFLTLTTELKWFTDFPTSEFDENEPWAGAHVVCDAIIEFDPQTGEIKDKLHTRDLLDLRRFGYMALSGFWKDKYNYLIQDYSRDWSHANALLYLPEEKSVIVSFRHLDCLIKIDWQTKKIKWIFGDPGGWGEAWKPYCLKPVGELEWPYHQHSPQLTPRGTLMLYDNGNYRARPFDEVTFAPDNQSRVVEFRIDEEEMTVEQVYEYRGTEDDRFYCPFYCEADWLPNTENILVTDGGHIELADGTPNDNVPAERQWARIFEITRDNPPEKVFEVKVDSGLDSEYGWSIYRANRFPNLYDGFSLVSPRADEPRRVFERVPHVKKTDLPYRANL